jgi:1-acyl-sn-glycerol-3-phosphate acyltransferase
MTVSAPLAHDHARQSISTHRGVNPLSRVALCLGYFAVLILFACGTAAFCCLALLRALGCNARERHTVTRATIHSGTRALFLLLKATKLLRVIEHEPLLTPTMGTTQGIIVANHPSMLDAMFFLSRHPQVVCVMKAELLKLPFIGTFARYAGYLPYDETPELRQRAEEAISEGAHILIFPEGTRSPCGGLNSFKRGAARLATELSVPLFPHSLQMDPLVLSRERPWWLPPEGPVTLRVKSLAPLIPSYHHTRAVLDQPSDSIRRESVKLTESLEVLINSSLSSCPNSRHRNAV